MEAAAKPVLLRISRERARILGPAVFVCLAAYIAAFRPLGIAPPAAVYVVDLTVLAALGALAFAIVTRRIPMRFAHAASAAVLWCPMAATLAPLWGTQDDIFATLLIMQIASAGVLMGSRWFVGTIVVANAIALPLLVAIAAPYTAVLISCVLTASLFASLIHVLMRRALLDTELMRLEHERTAAELASSEDSFRALVETSPDAMFVHGEASDSYAISWVNGAMMRLLGYERAEELLGRRSIDTFVHPDERARLGEHRKRVHSGEVSSGIDVRWVRRDGVTRHVHASSRPVTFAGRKAWMVVARDMTDQIEQERQRIEAEAATRKSEERYRLLFDGSPFPKCVFDADTLRFLAVNDQMVEVYGYTRVELLAMTVKDLQMPGDAPATVGVRRHRRKDGAVVEIEVTSHPIEIDGRRCVLAVGCDVTTARRVEEQLRHAQRMEAIGQLAGGVAHDFNNILAVILSNASLVAEELGPDHPLRPEILDIEAATGRAAGLTRQLLAFSRKQPRRVADIALNSLVTNLEKMLSRIVGEDIRMSASLAPQLGTVQADGGQLEQVLLNLVVNARDAMPTGGALTIETANVDVDETQAAVVGVRPGRHVMLTVTDTGCGMTAETRAHIFEPFFTTKPVGKGTGLGLATVFGIVGQSEGGIAVDSEVGRGTTFRIYLPRVDAAPAAVAIESVRVAPRRGAETVLVVEDDPLLRAVVRRQLQSFGYRLLEACDPATALEVAAGFAEPIDLLLTDLVMPGMDGRALARELVAVRPATKVLFMSGYSEHAAVKSAALDRRDRLIEKPFTAITLSHAIRETLDRRETIGETTRHRALA